VAARAPTTFETIDGRAAKSLAEAHAIQGVTILGQPGGWAVFLRYGVQERGFQARGFLERGLAAQRSRRLRLWRNLSTAAAFVREELGMARFEVDTAGHDPGAVERKRPDAAAALRRAHSSAEYDKWFCEQAKIGLEAADRGEFVSEEEAARRFARMLDR
jgi:hypothetical protein